MKELKENFMEEVGQLFDTNAEIINDSNATYTLVGKLVSLNSKRLNSDDDKVIFMSGLEISTILYLLSNHPELKDK